jgi:hypothetical protein
MKCFLQRATAPKSLLFSQKKGGSSKAPVPDNGPAYPPRIQPARRQQPCKSPNPEISEEKRRKKTPIHQSAHTAHSFSPPGPAALWVANQSRSQSAGSNPSIGRTSGLAGVSEGTRQTPSRSSPPDGHPIGRAPSTRLAFENLLLHLFQKEWNWATDFLAVNSPRQLRQGARERGQGK